MTDKSGIDSWRASLLPTDATIQQAIYSLENSCLQIVLAVAGDNKLAGTLTDGDIRRAFLKGYKLDSIIDEIIHRNPLVVPPKFSRELVLQLMQANKIHQLPVVDDDGIVVGLHVWNSIIEPVSLENLMVIMAGGKGTRLRPHTENCPKPMLEVGGKPMLEHIIEKAKHDGFKSFLISLNYLGEIIEDHFGDGNNFGVNIGYLREELPLGTAGCLSLIENSLQLPLIVTNGDVLTDINYNEFLDFHMRHQAAATMAVRQHEIQNQFGVVRTKGVEIEGFEEKPIYRSHVNAGIYVLNPDTLNYLQHKQHCDMPTLFERIKEKEGRTIVYPMHEPWLDVGRPEDLIRANNIKHSVSRS
jgi:dTDP-glucose pyrophosphorylase/predicted transcriptional regulator